MRVVGILLTGGRSSRMARPKALLGFEGETFLSHLIRTLEAGGIDDIVIVTGLHDAEIREASAGIPLAAGTRVVFNPEYEQGQLSSLLAGLEAASGHHPDAVLMALVDHPLVRASTIVKLVSAFHESRSPVVRPVFQGRHGHPVLFAEPIFDRLRTADPAEGARAVVRALGSAVQDVEVDDAGVTLDIDTPEAYERLVSCARGGRDED